MGRRYRIRYKPDRWEWFLIGAIVLVATIMLCIILAILRQNAETTPEAVPVASTLSIAPEKEPVTDIGGIPLHRVFLPEDSLGRPGVLRTVRSVTIHETANTNEGAGAKAHSDYLTTTLDEVSWHYTVDDHVIYQHLPDNEEAWHSGTRQGNHSSIGVELCVNCDGDFEKTLENGAKLTAFLLKEHDLSINDVKQHYDFNQKECPYTLRQEGRWEEFLTLVEEHL